MTTDGKSFMPDLIISIIATFIGGIMALLSGLVLYLIQQDFIRKNYLQAIKTEIGIKVKHCKTSTKYLQSIKKNLNSHKPARWQDFGRAPVFHAYLPRIGEIKPALANDIIRFYDLVGKYQVVGKNVNDSLLELHKMQYENDARKEILESTIKEEIGFLNSLSDSIIDLAEKI